MLAWRLINRDREPIAAFNPYELAIFYDGPGQPVIGQHQASPKVTIGIIHEPGSCHLESHGTFNTSAPDCDTLEKLAWKINALPGWRADFKDAPHAR